MATAIKDITRYMQQNDTLLELASMLKSIFHKYMQHQTDQLNNWNAEKLGQVIQDQIDIGWDNFFKGRILKGWSEVQNGNYKALDLPKCQAYKTGSWWVSWLIRQIVWFSLNSWQFWEDARYKDRVDLEYKQEHKKKLCKQGRYWYRYCNAGALGQKMQKIEWSNKDSNQSISCWLDSLVSHYKDTV